MTADDFVEAKTFHGESQVDSADLVSKLRRKNVVKQSDAVQDYLGKFDAHGGSVEQRAANYTKLVNNFYDLGVLPFPSSLSLPGLTAASPVI
jgi:hypothetical protein